MSNSIAMLPGVAGSGLASAMQHCSSHRPLKYPSSKALRPHMSGPIGIPAFSRRFSKMAVSMTAIYVEFLKGFDNQTFHWNFANMPVLMTSLLSGIFQNRLILQLLRTCSGQQLLHDVALGVCFRALPAPCCGGFGNGLLHYSTICWQIS